MFSWLSDRYIIEKICLRVIKLRFWKTVILLLFLYPFLPVHVILHAFRYNFSNLSKNDVIWLNHSYFVFWVPKKHRKQCVVDIHADPVVTYRKYAEKNIVYYIFFNFEIFKMRLYERLLLSTTKLVIICSKQEADWYSVFCNVLFLPNGTDVRVEPPRNDLINPNKIRIGFLPRAMGLSTC